MRVGGAVGVTVSGMGMSDYTRNQIRDTYGNMASRARYRPAAPAGPLGEIYMPDAELDIEQEKDDYTAKWWRQEDEGNFFIGCANGSTRPAMIYAVEAARLLCGGSSNDPNALELLRMAVEYLEGMAEE